MHETQFVAVVSMSRRLLREAPGQEHAATHVCVKGTFCRKQDSQLTMHSLSLRPFWCTL